MPGGCVRRRRIAALQGGSAAKRLHGETINCFQAFLKHSSSPLSPVFFGIPACLKKLRGLGQRPRCFSYGVSPSFTSMFFHVEFDTTILNKLTMLSPRCERHATASHLSSHRSLPQANTSEQSLDFRSDAVFVNKDIIRWRDQIRAGDHTRIIDRGSVSVRENRICPVRMPHIDIA